MGRQETGRWRNNRAENSHQPLRRREKIMGKFRRPKSLQKFAAVQSSIHNHFNLERHLYSRPDFKENRSVALRAWARLSKTSSLRHSSLSLPLNDSTKPFCWGLPGAI